MKITQLLCGQPFMTGYGIVGYSSVELIETKGRRILYDCGSRGCSVQLKEALHQAGTSAEEITDVVVSHLHFDHVGNLPLFSKARIWMSGTEWDCALTEPDEYHCAATAAWIRESGRLSFIEEGDFLEEDLQVMALPGHTKGLIGLRAQGDILLVSDAIKNRYELWAGTKPMSVDVEASRRSFSRILETARILYPGHDVCLDLERKNPAPVDFVLRYADGQTRRIVREE